MDIVTCVYTSTRSQIHSPHGKGGLSLDSNPVCLRVNGTNLDQNPCVNGAIDSQVIFIFFEGVEKKDVLCR